MAGRGRPTLYRRENAELARKFCMLGAINKDLAGLFEVARRTIDNWITNIPEFAESVRQGRDVADAAVVEKLHSRAVGYSYEAKKVFLYRGEPVTVNYTVRYPPETTACMFWLRNRCRRHWLEKAQPPESRSGRAVPRPRERGRQLERTFDGRRDLDDSYIGRAPAVDDCADGATAIPRGRRFSSGDSTSCRPLPTILGDSDTAAPDMVSRTSTARGDRSSRCRGAPSRSRRIMPAST